MGAQPGDCADNHTFSLPAHQDMNLTNEQCAERIAKHFAEISCEYPPLNPSLLPERVKARLADGTRAPLITELDVYEKLKAAKKPKAVIPGDLPNSIVKEFIVELVSPLSKLYNSITQTAKWPKQYKVEYVTPIGKVPLPQSEDDLQPISLTAFFSKVMEQFIVSWLMEIIGNKKDFRQYGGTKGNSICHYLIEFVNFFTFSTRICI